MIERVVIVIEFQSGDVAVRKLASNKNKYKESYVRMLLRDLVRNKNVYIMALPVVAYYIIFHYVPMYGASIAFKDFDIAKGIWGSPWVGFKHFKDFFDSFYFWRLMKNTLLISMNSLVWGFPAPIIFALLINEIKSKHFKKAIQTITYMPHFISLVVICGLVVQFCARDGIITQIFMTLGGPEANLLSKKEYFRTIYVSSGIWHEVGWGSIIYLAALTGIDSELYEAATIDGAGRFRQLWNITIPGILPTIVILLILRIGHLMGVGFEKIFLLYNAGIYETADVISTYVYRKGLSEGFQFSFASAVGIFNSVINFILLILANKLSKKVTENSLW